jgi:hypothetical protein
VLTELVSLKISLDVVTSADLEITPLLQRECQNETSGTFFADYLQSDSNKRRSVIRNSHKTMKLQGFVTFLVTVFQVRSAPDCRKRENFFRFDHPEN